jgi:plasmid maintenance system antidote protein VapI/Zn-dependent peptidase ImmA (M78 family)
MPDTLDFRPDWLSAPGETILDILNERHLSVSQFASLMRQTADEVENLLEGRVTITLAVARQLSKVLGGSVEFWISRDFQYRDQAARLHVNDEGWLSELPLGDMIKYGWLNPVPRPTDEISACLSFFGVADISAWRTRYRQLLDIVAFRTSASFDSIPGAVAAWLRRAEMEGEKIECRPWNADGFKDSLYGVRSLTRMKSPQEFIPELQKRCAENGVAVVVERAPTGCRVSGATWFVSEEKALLLLSFRYLSDDHFWFSFFHEAGHLLLHGKKALFLEGDELMTTTQEDEANEFAADILVPSELRASMLKLPLDGRKVIRFAHRIGVSSGIVVGQLQHYGRITHKQLNNLKRRFVWE